MTRNAISVLRTACLDQDEADDRFALGRSDGNVTGGAGISQLPAARTFGRFNRRVDLNDLRLLMQVVANGSYTAASRATGIPKSTISQRIAALEQAMGTGLLRRTSRSLSLTEAGELLLTHARTLEDVARQVEQSFLEHGGELRGTLRISASSALTQAALSGLVHRFLAQHEGASIWVEASSRAVDLIGEGFDLVLLGHVGPLRNSTLLQRVVARTPWALAASPEWIAERGSPSAPENVPEEAVLTVPAANDESGWTLRRGEEERSLRASARLLSSDMLTLRAAAVAGGGIAYLPRYLMRNELSAGHLVPVLSDWEAKPSAISVLTLPKAQSSRLASAFSDFLAAELPQALRG